MQDSIASPEQLVQARQSRGLTPEEVARDLKLAPRQLEALESGNWSMLPGLAFVRGMLRAYGRLLDADVQPLLQEVSARVVAAELRAVASLDQPLPRRSMLGFGAGGQGSRVVWIALVLVGLIMLALFFGGGARLSSIESWLTGGNASVIEPQAPTEAPPAPVGEPPAEAQPQGTDTKSGTVTVPVPLQLPSAESLRRPPSSGTPQTDAARPPTPGQQ